MKRVSITSIVATLIWASLAVIGYGLTENVRSQHVPGYPNSGQIIYYIIFPAGVAAVAAYAGIGFWAGRFKPVSVVALVLSFLVLLPYRFFYT